MSGRVRYGFCKKLLLYECNFDQLPTFFIKIRFFLLMKKWATGQSCICKEVTSYKVHSLVGGGD